MKIARQRDILKRDILKELGEETNGDRPATKQDAERVLELVLRLHQDLDRRFADIDRRFEALERRMDRMAETLFAVHSQMGALTKSADRLDKNNQDILSTQVAQQRAIDELAARVTKLESRQQ